MPNRGAIRAWVRAETLVEATMMSDADINAIIDQGTRDISTRFEWPFLAATSTIAFVANQQAYNLPADFDRLAVALVDNTSTRLQEVSPESYWSSYGDVPATGTPSYFLIWGSQLWVSPVPTAATGGLVIYYWRMPTLMTDDSHSPEFASQFHLILADFACQHLWHREEDFSKARAYGERFLEGVERMARYYLGRAQESPFVMGDGLDRIRRTGNLGWRFPFFP